MNLLSIIVFLVIISLLVVAHEYGHFLFARIFKIKVHEFSIGFGTKLWTYLRKNGTDFNIRAVPMGGFVRMSGEDLEEMDEPDGFQSKPAYVRFAVIFAGPFFSFLFAVIIFMLLGYVWGLPDGTDNSVQMVMPGTPAAKMDLRAGDKVLRVNKEELSYPGQLVDAIRRTKGKVSLIVSRKGKQLTKTAEPNLTLRYFLGANWEDSDGTVKISGVIKETPLDKQGIKPDSILVSMNGKKYASAKELWADAPHEGEKVTLVLHSGYDKKTVSFTAESWSGLLNGREIIFPSCMFISTEPESGSWYDTGNTLSKINNNSVKTPEDIASASGRNIRIEYKDTENTVHEETFNSLVFQKKIGFATPVLGFVPGYHLKKTCLGESMKTGLESVWNMLTMTFTMLFSKQVKDNLGGPIAIVSMTNSAVNTGIFSLIILLGGLSLSLAIFNLFPIPPLDGGHLFIIIIETIRRKRFTKEQLMRIYTIGIIIMVLIFVLVFGLDITKLLTGTMPK